MEVKTNIGKEFLQILKECFPKGNVLNKIFNTNNTKISYSCLPNMARRFKKMNIRKMNDQNIEKEAEPISSCKCRNLCPVNGECTQNNICIAQL